MNTSLKIKSWEEAKVKIQEWQAENKKVVFTNGCFDLVHLGHIDYLEKAYNLGDYLVVGVNSDASVSRLKGPTRPLQDQYARQRLMAALHFVDLVVLFDEDTPLKLIQNLSPDILTKGNDYSIENIVGADHVIQHGGEVLTIALVDGYSTSSIIKKVIDQNT